MQQVRQREVRQREVRAVQVQLWQVTAAAADVYITHDVGSCAYFYYILGLLNLVS